MNEMKKVLISIVCFSLGLVACKDEKEDYGAEFRKAFEQQTEYGVYRRSQPCFVFNKVTHQIAETNHSFRIQTDIQDSCLMCRWPAHSTDRFTLSVHAKSLGKLLSSGDYQVILLKKSHKKNWLWDAQEEIGFIIEMLNE